MESDETVIIYWWNPEDRDIDKMDEHVRQKEAKARELFGRYPVPPGYHLSRRRRVIGPPGFSDPGFLWVAVGEGKK